MRSTLRLWPLLLVPLLMGQRSRIYDHQLASPYSGVGACSPGEFVTTLSRNAAPTCAVGGGGPGAVALDDLTDATITAPATGSVLVKSAGDWIDGQVDLADTDALTGLLPEGNIAASVTRDSEVPGLETDAAHDTCAEITDCVPGAIGAEVNDLTAAVTWADIPDANVPAGITRDAEVPGLETDAAHDTCAEITDCVVGALTVEVDGDISNELQNLFATIDVPSGTDPVADLNADTLVLSSTGTISIAGDEATDTIALNVADDQITPNQLADTQTLDADLTFSTGAFGVIFNVANPASGGIDVNGTGAYTGDLLHVHQHTGNPGAGNLIHAEAEDVDISPILHSTAHAPSETGVADTIVGLQLDTDDDNDNSWVPFLLQDDAEATPDTIFKIDYTGKITTGTIDDTSVLFADTDANFAATTIGAAVSELDETNGAGLPNQTDYKVNWDQIGNMPAVFADESDDGAGSGDNITAQAAFSDPVNPIFNDTTTVGVSTTDASPDTVTWDVVDNSIGVTQLAAALTFEDADLVNLSLGGNLTTTAEGLILPAAATACPETLAEGQVCWEWDEPRLWIGEGGGGHWTAVLGADVVADEMADDQILVGTGVRTANYVAMSGDASIISDGTVEVTQADALETDPTDCSANTWATTIAANGNLTCAAVSGDAGITDDTVVEADLNTEDYGDFSCGAGADDCLLDANSVATGDISADTITAGDVAASLDTRVAAQLVIVDPDPAAVNYVFYLPPWAGTMTRIDCEAINGTNVVIDLCDGEDYADDTCATSIPGATMTCDTTGANDTALTNPGFAARDKLSLTINSESGTVDRLIVYITATVD